jgi:uncharacterized protein YjiS (DUF1127 family)
MFDFSARGLLVTARSPSTRTADRPGRSPYLWLLDTLRVWGERNRQRHALRLLAERDDYLLKDIGLSQDDAFQEAAKSFWQR